MHLVHARIHINHSVIRKKDNENEDKEEEEIAIPTKMAMEAKDSIRYDIKNTSSKDIDYLIE